VARDFVYVDDVCEAYLLVAGKPPSEPGGIYNVGTGVQTTLRDVVDYARSLFGIESEPAWQTMPNRSWDTNVWVADNRKIDRELSWRPRITVPQGLRMTTEWLQQQPAMRELYTKRPGST
jgi:dolichol-phosphate mannosyltransferase